MDGSVGRGRGGRWVGVSLGGLLAGLLAISAVSQGCDSPRETVFYPDPEAGPPNEGGSSGSAATPRCPSDTPVDAKSLEWKPPANPQPGACKDADIEATKTYLATNPSASNEDFENFVKNRDRACHDCIFGDADGQLWPPAPVRAGKVVTFNVGACYAIVTGLQECGRAVQNAWDCGFEACLLCDSASALQACRAKVQTGACAGFEQAARTSCGVAGKVDEVCGAPFDSIRVQCMTTVSPVVDSGTD